MKRAIEEDFPIVEINRLAAPERNSFKPIYQMHKWFARRASCVFRAILLGALKPAGTNIMEEFYKDHSNDPDTNGKIILDPFMGGGTTIVEALRLGCKVVGVDLNPVAWFIVKTEVEPVDSKELDASFERLANRIVPWSGRPLRETLLQLYQTAPPWIVEEVCGLPNSDVIYTFWAKSAVCTSPTCRKQVPLFTDYVLAAKSPSIRYYPDCKCPKCDANFDWEVEPAALIADPHVMFHGNIYSGGVGRSSERWTYAHEEGGIYVCQGRSILKKDGKVNEGSPEWIHVLRQCQSKTGMLEAGQVCCPNCNEIVRPRLTAKKKKRKKVPLTVLLCPQTEDVFQWRGEIAPDAMVTSPAGVTFNPHKAHVADKGRFVCPHCGNNDAIIASIRSLPKDQLLPIHAYGLQAYAPGCDPSNNPDKNGGTHDDLFGEEGENGENETGEEDIAKSDVGYSGPFVPATQNLIWKQSGKFYARHAPADQALYGDAERLWQKNMHALPYPKSQIPSGQETDRLNEHHYCHWHQMFNSRQLLGLSTLLQGIKSETNVACQEMLLSAFFSLIEGSNMFARYKTNQSKSESAKGIFSRHDFQPKTTPCEDHVWGVAYGKGFVPWFQIVKGGKRWAKNPDDCSYDSDGTLVRRHDGSRAEASGVHTDKICLDDRAANIRCGDSRNLADAVLEKADFIITDPPYADNVNYAELADFFYVWLRLLLKERYPIFSPEHTPKLAEIVQNKSRGVSAEDFGEGLEAVFRTCHSKLVEDGLMVFTFHHAEGSAWENLLSAVMNSGFEIEAIYPVQSEGESSLHLQDNDAIAYDLIHVCRKRRPEDTRTKRSWAGLRQSVRQRAKEEITRIEAGRYGGRPLPSPDIRMVLIGKCLEVYSRHYGAVMDWNGEPFPIKSALQDIRLMVEQIVSRETPLPSELENLDALTQVWLMSLFDKREVSVDSISKSTRGVFEVSDLTGHKPPLLRKGRVKGGRTYEVLTPSERLDGLRLTLRGAESNAQQLALLAADDNAPIAFGPELVDVIHLLAGNAEQGERLDHLVERFRGQREQIRAALQYLKQRDPDRWSKSADKLLPFYDDMFAQTAAANNPK
jgi:16S rRNA G966 N2-methylase RsmD